ncbi:BTAD domain-containing putative transcriptional regulator [Actinoplanes sp. NPDC051861]|uniref:AfsR/SARP family transcriptional regulator n=1 Tax=Actinoplanes sp. NPDC051861 TaxID=3155170 RepID=UPI0034390DA0
MLDVQILGRTRVWRDGTEADLGPPGQRALFGLLILAGGQPLTRQAMVEALWPVEAPRAAANILQTYAKRLRRCLEPGRLPRARSAALPAVADGYAFAAEDATVDVLRFRQSVRAARRAERIDDTTGALAAYGLALALWHGPPLADVPLLAAHPGVTALVVEHRQVVARYGELMTAAGRSTEVLAMLAEDAMRHPLDEAAQARLVRACHAAGQRARAFEVYRATRLRLAEELGVDPAPDLVSAYRELLSGHRPVPVQRSPEG